MPPWFALSAAPIFFPKCTEYICIKYGISGRVAWDQLEPPLLRASSQQNGKKINLEFPLHFMLSVWQTVVFCANQFCFVCVLLMLWRLLPAESIERMWSLHWAVNDDEMPTTTTRARCHHHPHAACFPFISQHC